ncbi:hypothetical protein OEZ85_005218 [Tetradesmus obliquus]|uniref:SP-RING-type domain-containing protein n=1 Tax=Tetradesmus obliquus TaxID=3088 RepID=A0ABY8UIJ7_TETOB|nr:hypothetical protein OEZ85_005218 [Tetradesmus obliquus]
MFSSATQANPSGETNQSTAASRNPGQNGSLSAEAPTFVPRPVGSTAEQQQQQQHAGRGGAKGPRGRGRSDSRGGLSRALQDRPTGEQQDQQQQPRQARQQQQRGGGRSQGSRPQRQQQQQQQQGQQHGSRTQLRQQQQQQQQQQANADGSPERGGSSSGGYARPPAPSSATKGRQVAANHLLNFQYDTARSTRGGRGGAAMGTSSAGRRRFPAPRPQRYDKEKFLQANFRFLVSSVVDTRQFDSNADRMFDWDDVLLVDMASATPIQCPISLESPPLCPQITPCGHVYSFGSIMQHLMTHGGEALRRSAPCPLCYQPVVARELRLVTVREVTSPSVGSTVTFQLLCRPKGSIIPVPVAAAAATAAAAAGTSTAAAGPTEAAGSSAAAAAAGSSPSSTPSGTPSNYAACPPTVTGKLVELEDMVQDEACRRRWKFLSHLPLHGTFRLGEVTLLQPQLTAEDLAPFSEELSNRDKRRKRKIEAARRESRREAAAAAAAQRARQGPTAAELLAMPRLGGSAEAGAAAAAAAGSDAAGSAGAGISGLTPEQMEEALAAQVMHDTALGAAGGSGSGAVLGSSPPGGEGLQQQVQQRALGRVAAAAAVRLLGELAG